MEKLEVECCDTVMTHECTIQKVKENMPAEDTLKELAEFYKVFGCYPDTDIVRAFGGGSVCLRSGGASGYDAVRYFSSIACIKTDEAGEEQKGRKDGILFSGRRTYSDNYQSGHGAYCRVKIRWRL